MFKKLFIKDFSELTPEEIFEISHVNNYYSGNLNWKNNT